MSTHLQMTPNEYWIIRKRYWGGFHTPRHFYLFSKESLTKIVEDAGLSVINHKFIAAGPFWTFSVISWLHLILKITWTKPLYTSPLFTPLVIFFTVFDSIRLLFHSKSSQQVLLVSLKEK